VCLHQKWPESLFENPTPLLFQNIFIRPGSGIFQIWESDTCSKSGYCRSNRNLPMFFLKKWPRRLLLLTKLKVTPDPGPVFHNILTPGPDPKQKSESCRSPLRHSGSNVQPHSNYVSLCFFSVSSLPQSFDVRMPSFLSHYWIPAWWSVNDATVEVLLKCFAPLNIGRVQTPIL